MLNEITDCVISGRLQKVYREDEEYRRLSQEQRRAARQCYQNVPEEYHDWIDQLMERQNDCACRHIELSYQQGMIDCARLLAELGLLSQREAGSAVNKELYHDKK